MRSSRARWRVIRVAAGVMLAAGALVVVLSRVDRAALWAACRQADAGWVLAALGSVLVTLLLVTARWSVLLGAGRPRLRALWDAVVIGQAVNILFSAPLRRRRPCGRDGGGARPERGRSDGGRRR